MKTKWYGTKCEIFIVKRGEEELDERKSELQNI
jgi:hypothetical protein